MLPLLEPSCASDSRKMGNALKRGSQWQSDAACQQQQQQQQQPSKRIKCTISGFTQHASSPLIAGTVDAMNAVAMSSRNSSCGSVASSPYVEIEDYILEGYGSALINGSYNSRLSLDNLTPVNYCLYDADLEECDDSDNGASDGKTLVETPEPQDVVMQD